MKRPKYKELYNEAVKEIEYLRHIETQHKTVLKILSEEGEDLLVYLTARAAKAWQEGKAINTYTLSQLGHICLASVLEGHLRTETNPRFYTSSFQAVLLRGIPVVVDLHRRIREDFTVNVQ